MAVPSMGEVHRLMAPQELKNLVRYKGPSSSEAVMKQAATNSELQKAVEKGDVNMAKGILRYGAAKRCVNVNAPLWPKRERLLHLAASRSRELCLLLLEARGEMDVEEIRDGQQPLHVACQYGQLDVCELLLDRKAHLEEPTFTGRRPLHWAAANGHTEVCDMLLDRRASIHAVSGDTWQALHHAAAQGHAQVVSLLCRRGAKADVETTSGTSAFQLACLGDHLLAVKSLLDFGALFSLEELTSGALRRCEGTEIEDLVREVGQLRFQVDEAEEMASMGQGEEALGLFQEVYKRFIELGMRECAATVRRDAAKVDVEIEMESEAVGV